MLSGLNSPACAIPDSHLHLSRCSAPSWPPSTPLWEQSLVTFKCPSRCLGRTASSQPPCSQASRCYRFAGLVPPRPDRRGARLRRGPATHMGGGGPGCERKGCQRRGSFIRSSAYSKLASIQLTALLASGSCNKTGLRWRRYHP